MKTKIYWTQMAQDDLRAIRAHISRDAPSTATAYVRKIRKSVKRLEDMPLSGQVVPELGQESIREIYQGNYRIIHQVTNNRIDILTVFHGSRILDDSSF